MTTGSILSWEDGQEESPILTKARQALTELDTTEAQAELDAEAKARQELSEAKALGMVPEVPAETLLKPVTEQEPIIGTKGIALPTMNIDYGNAKTAMERAERAVTEYNKQFTFGERVLAKNKRLINAKTDLNQLIPFKYSWAWQMYLDSTAGHWMPQEITTYARDMQTYEHLTPTQKMMVSGLVVNYMYGQYIYPATMLVNVYRLSTNPEVRQYDLRQVFEEQVFHHSMRHIIESFDLGKSDILLHRNTEQVYKDRNTLIYPYISKLADLSTSTESPEDIGDFLVALAVMYGGMRGLYHLVPMMRIWQADRDYGVLNGVKDNIIHILRDMQRQWDFGIRYIKGIIDENPNVVTRSVVDRITFALSELERFNSDMMDTVEISKQDREEIAHCSAVFKNTFLREIGLTPTPLNNKPHLETFVQMFNSLNKPISDHGPTSTTGGGGGLGDWD